MSSSGSGHPQERLSEYLDDQLSIEERAAIDRHLAACEECRGTLHAMRRLSRAIAEETVPPLPADLNEKIGRRLDGATVLRPARWRFGVPVTIAATISAIGILVAILWREGGLTPPVDQEGVGRPQIADDKRAGESLPPAPLPEPPRRDEQVPFAAKEKKDEVDALGKDLDSRRNSGDAEVGALAGAPAVSVEGSAEEGTGGAHENRERVFKAAENQAAADQTTSSAFLQKQAAAAPSSPRAAKAEVATPCADRWSDSGARGTWVVADPAVAAHELDTIVLDVGGTGQWRGVDDGRPYQLITPRSRYLEVFYALRARGIVGLDDPPALSEGDDCTAISITIVPAR